MEFRSRRASLQALDTDFGVLIKALSSSESVLNNVLKAIRNIQISYVESHAARQA